MDIQIVSILNFCIKYTLSTLEIFRTHLKCSLLDISEYFHVSI